MEPFVIELVDLNPRSRALVFGIEQVGKTATCTESRGCMDGPKVCCGCLGGREGLLLAREDRLSKTQWCKCCPGGGQLSCDSCGSVARHSEEWNVGGGIYDGERRECDNLSNSSRGKTEDGMTNRSAGKRSTRAAINCRIVGCRNDSQSCSSLWTQLPAQTDKMAKGKSSNPMDAYSESPRLTAASRLTSCMSQERLSVQRNLKRCEHCLHV